MRRKTLTRLQTVEQKPLTLDPMFGVPVVRACILLNGRPRTSRPGTHLPHPHALRPPFSPFYFPDAHHPLSTMQNMFLTGMPTWMTGLSDRLYATLRLILPPEMPLWIVRAADLSLAVWR